MRTVLLIFAGLSIVLFSCKSTKDSSQKSTSRQVENNADIQQLVLLEKHVDSIRRDDFEVHSFSVTGDVLEVFVSYGGGCGEANFEMYYTQRVMHSMPPQTVIHIGFIDGDPCRSIETRKLIFDLEPFKPMAEGGGIWLILGGSELRQLYKK